MYLDHIEGNVDPETRVGNRPDSANAGEEGRSQADEDEKKSVSKKGDTAESQRLLSQSSVFSYGRNGAPKNKYDLPDSCKVELLKAGRVEKLEEDYFLMAHPFPQFEGEMVLF